MLYFLKDIWLFYVDMIKSPYFWVVMLIMIPVSFVIYMVFGPDSMFGSFLNFVFVFVLLNNIPPSEFRMYAKHR